MFESLFSREVLLEVGFMILPCRRNFGGCSKSSRQLQLLITDGPCLPPLSWFWTLQDNTSQKKFGLLVPLDNVLWFYCILNLVKRWIGCDGESRILFIGARQRDYFDGQEHCNAVSQCFLGNVTVAPEFWTKRGHWCVLVVKMAW